jgi:hypothetical protein
MPDILNDVTSVFIPNVMPDLNNDVECHLHTRDALQAVNRFAFGERGAPGLTSRSIVEDGAIANDLDDNRARIQATLDAVAAAGGGIALVPASAPGVFRWLGTITVPLNVTLSGLGDRSVLRGLPEEGQPAIRFAGGIHRGGVERLVLLGLLAKPPADQAPRTGIDFSGAQFLRLHDLQIWDFPIGVVLSDGVTEYAGSNHLGAFEINRCDVGLRAFRHCNGCSVREGRIWHCRNGGAGIAIDVDSADVLGLEHLVVEDWDLGVRVRGLTKTTLRDVYYEADQQGETFPGRWLDIQPLLGSIVKLENSQVNVSRSITMAGSLEDAITTDSLSAFPFGAKRHHAASPERNLLENGDFRRGDDSPVPLGWQLNFAPTVAPNSDDFVTAPRSYDITQTNNANDGISTSFTVPETTDFVSVMVRFKNLTSSGAFFTLVSGGNVAQFAVSTPPDAATWQTAAWTVPVDSAAAGVVSVILTADQNAAGGQIRVDEVWAVVGATAAPPRAHAHRIEMLPDPITLLERVVQATQAFDELDLRQVQGLGRPPRGVIGAILSIRGTASPARGNGGILDPSGIGATLPRAVRPFIRDVDTKERWALNLIYDRLEHDRQVILRGLTFVDGADLFTAEFFASYRIDLVGWVHPS